MLIAVCDDMPVECANIARQIETILKQSDTDFVIKKFFGAQELIQSRESFDIVFLDIKMPEISGMELAKEMRKQAWREPFPTHPGAQNYPQEYVSHSLRLMQ